MDGRYTPQDAVATRRREDAALRRRRVGTLRYEHRLDSGARSLEEESRKASRAAAALADRSDTLQRAAARRSDRRANEPGHGGTANPHQRRHTDPLPGDGTSVGERRSEPEEQVAFDHRG